MPLSRPPNQGRPDPLYNDRPVSKPVKLTITVAFLALMAYVVLSSLALSKARCEVCMEFKGRSPAARPEP